MYSNYYTYRKCTLMTIKNMIRKTSSYQIVYAALHLNQNAD